jgi:hypothetical protein
MDGDGFCHERSDDCPCGPTTVPLPQDDGSMEWMIAHHSLDGRELREPGESG